MGPELMKSATPLKKSDDFRDFIELTGYSVTASQHFGPMIPTLLEKMLKDLLTPLIAQGIYFSVIFD